MKFRQIKKRVKKETGLIIRKSINSTNSAYTYCCPNGYSILLAVVGVSIDNIEYLTNTALCIDISF